MAIYAQIGTPEIWRYVEGGVKIYGLKEGSYVIQETSPSFSFVSADRINGFLADADAQDDNALVRAWRKWIRQELKT